MEYRERVCGECKFFTNEDTFGDGWCDKHGKECFCENGACKDSVAKKGDFSFHTCGECDAFCECGLGGSRAAKADDTACQYFDDTLLNQLEQ